MERKGAKKGKTTSETATKPVLNDYKEKIKVERDAIEEAYKLMKEIAEKVSGLKLDQSDYLKQKNNFRTQLDEVSKEIQDLEAKRVAILEEMEELQKNTRDKRSKVQSFKRNLPYQTEEALDAQIKALEKHLMSTRIPVAEENRIIAQIKQMKANRPLFSAYANLEADANVQSQTAVLSLKTQFDSVRDQLRTFQQKKKELTEKLRDLISENQKKLTPARELNEEREKIKKEIASHKSEEQRLSEELRIKFTEYQAQMVEQQKVTSEKKREEKRKREIEQEKKNLQRQIEELDEDFKSPEHQLIQQTLIYLKKLIESSSSKPEQAEEQTPTKQFIDQEGLQLYVKNKDTTNEGPSKGKKKDKKKKHLVSLKQPLVLDIGTLFDFEKLSISPPLTLEDCPACLERLEKRMKDIENEKLISSESTMNKKSELLAKLQALESQA